MKVLLKPKKEEWVVCSFSLRTTTHQKLKEAREISDHPDGADIKTMLDNVVLEVANTIISAGAGPTTRTTSYTNGSIKVEE